MRNEFYTDLKSQLDTLRRNGTFKELRYSSTPVANRAVIEGYGEAVILCSNNYLGMSNNPEVVAAGEAALRKYGAGAASVRFICGTYDIHRTLESRVADFLSFESSLSYTSCWAANTAAIPALLAPGDTVISDELNHASIIDGCRMVAKGVTRAVYKHADMASLCEKLEAAKDSRAVLIVTDGVFSMEGDVAPLPDIIALARQYGALVMVDDSHATGVIGKTGRGTMEHYGITEGVDIISGTFGKALGGAGGGFIAASRDICDMLVQKSRPHLFSNALPPALCGIAIGAIDYLDGHPQIVKSLHEKTAYMRGKLKERGLKPLDGDSAIIPIIIGETSDSIRASELMMKNGVFAIGFGFPVVPEGTARIRLQVSDGLSYQDIDHSLDVICNAVNEVL